MQTGLKNLRVFVSLCLSVSVTQLHAETSRPVVFVSVPPQKQIIEMLTGENVDVRIMLSPGQSPETFAPTPKQISTLAGAQTYFEAGVPFEVTWRDTILAVNPEIRIVNCCESLAHGQASQQGKQTYLHIWTDPVYTIEMARLARDELVILLPAQEEQIKQKFYHLESVLRQLHFRIERLLAERQTSYFIISHSALDAFSDRYRLKQLSLETNGREIGLNSLREVVILSRRENLKVLFIVEQYRTPLVTNLAKELNAEVVRLDILSENYIQNMIVITNQIARALWAQ